MANFSKHTAFHQALTGAQEDVITLDAASGWVEIINRDATPANAIYYRIFGRGQGVTQVAAAVAGDDSFVVMGGAGPASSRRHAVPSGGGGVVIRVIAANPSPMSVQAVDGPSI